MGARIQIHMVWLAQQVLHELKRLFSVVCLGLNVVFASALMRQPLPFLRNTAVSTVFSVLRVS